MRTPEENRAHVAAWRAAHPERARASSRRGRRAWERRNPEAAAMHRRREAQRERCKRRGATFVEYVDPLVVLERDEGLCGVCDQDVDVDRFDLDHVVPLGAAGEHSYANVQVAHPACNNAKRRSEA